MLSDDIRDQECDPHGCPHGRSSYKNCPHCMGLNNKPDESVGMSQFIIKEGNNLSVKQLADLADIFQKLGDMRSAIRELMFPENHQSLK